MSEEMKKVNETNEEMNETPAADQQKQENAAEDKSEKIGFMQKCKNFGKNKVVPAAKLVGKGVAKGASIAGGALATAYLIGMAIGGYAAVKGKNTTEESDQAEQSSSSESATTEKPADQDVQVSLTEQNVQVETTIE